MTSVHLRHAVYVFAKQLNVCEETQRTFIVNSKSDALLISIHGPITHVILHSLTVGFRANIFHYVKLVSWQWRRHGGGANGGSCPPTLSGVNFEISANPVRKLVR